MRALVVSLLLVVACGPSAPTPPSLSPTAVLASPDNTGYARAMAPRPFSFPADHGAHPEFRSEWWYFTGHLSTLDGRRFGYQLTIFRQALAPDAPARPSAWATRQVYMGHFALTDVDGRRFVAFERTAREGLGLAGARVDPLRVWVADWEIAGSPEFPVHLKARDGDTAIDLQVGAGRGPVLQGDRGLSPKGPEPGNASYYFSHTRMPSRGRVVLQGQAFTVTGESWLDREWSTSALGPDLAGWDWLSLSLSDGRDVMVFRLRRRDGSAAAQSRATLISPDGSTLVLTPDDHTFAPAGEWRSPQSGARYPAGFRLALADLNLEVRPLLPDQELRVSFRYWEGAVVAEGRAGLEAVRGRGYLELTGYDPVRR